MYIIQIYFRSVGRGKSRDAGLSQSLMIGTTLQLRSRSKVGDLGNNLPKCCEVGQRAEAFTSAKFVTSSFRASRVSSCVVPSTDERHHPDLQHPLRRRRHVRQLRRSGGRVRPYHTSRRIHVDSIFMMIIQLYIIIIY